MICDEFNFIPPKSTFLITGATGFVGQALSRLLLEIGTEKDLRVIAAVRDIERAKKTYADAAPKLAFCQYENTVPLAIDEPIDYIFCLGAATDKAMFAERPADAFWQNVSGIRHCLSFAEAHRGTKSVLFVSSVSAVQPGLLERMDAASASYGVSKRMGEALCQWYADRSGVPVKIARPFSVYGEGEHYDRGSFLSDFINNVRHGEDIVLKSSGTAVRNLCHVEDVARALLYVCCKGANGAVYDIGSPVNNFSILKIAQKICGIANQNGAKVNVSAPPRSDDEPPAWNQIPDVSALQALGWRELRGEMDEELSKIVCMAIRQLKLRNTADDEIEAKA